MFHSLLLNIYAFFSSLFHFLPYFSCFSTQCKTIIKYLFYKNIFAIFRFFMCQNYVMPITASLCSSSSCFFALLCYSSRKMLYWYCQLCVYRNVFFPTKLRQPYATLLATTERCLKQLIVKNVDGYQKNYWKNILEVMELPYKYVKLVHAEFKIFVFFFEIMKRKKFPFN